MEELVDVLVLGIPSHQTNKKQLTANNSKQHRDRDGNGPIKTEFSNNGGAMRIGMLL